ncbi:hypothetical protein [Luteibacter yeojuensis]|uniref:Uncharacterized protein n=1 Tax=Luteibacter yeojuensis TaxID=345309 RepID=A0A7X5TQ00_9GAMM|nr:hypothetical protein [Luteibacter yeojuensis]NID15605.1 hypothetical protein [Luteibacter yeojuensis]
MHITPLCSPVPGDASKAMRPSQGPQPQESRKQDRPPLSNRIDFSRVTPRQLQEYLDEMIFSEQIDLLDATALSTSLPSGIFERAPDTPIDLRAQIEGMIEFDRNNGFDLLATFYTGLLERMKMMEDRSVHISVTA